MLSKIKNKILGMSTGTKSAITYTLATLFSRGLAIITVPIFTRIMTTSQIGTVNLYNSWYSLISAFATLSLTSGGYIVALNEFSEKRNEYQSSVLTLTSIISVGLAVLFFISPSFWKRITGLSYPLLLLMLVGFLFAPARDFWLARQRYEYKYKLSAVVIVVSAVIASVLSIIVVISMNKNGSQYVAEGRLFTNYLVIYGVAAIIWFSTFFKGKTFINIGYWRFSLSLSVPLIGYSIAAQILSVSDRTMISKMVDNSAVGIYSTLYTVSSLSLMIWQAIHASFVPYLFKNINNQEGNVKKITNSLVIVYAFVAIGMTYFAPEIVKILATKDYYEAIYIMPPIAAGVFLTCFTNIYSDIPLFYKKTKYVMYPAVIAAVINLVLNYIFIQLFGYMAAAYTTLFSYIVWAILQAYWGRKLCRKNGLSTNSIFDDKILCIIAVVTIMMCLFGVLLYRSTVLRYTMALTVVLGGIVVTYIFKKKGMIKKENI